MLFGDLKAEVVFPKGKKYFLLLKSHMLGLKRGYMIIADTMLWHFLRTCES